jgi:hypothetical protein
MKKGIFNLKNLKINFKVLKGMFLFKLRVAETKIIINDHFLVIRK